MSEKEKKTFTKLEKQELLSSFGELLDDQSLRIIEALRDSGKDLNQLLIMAWSIVKP